MSSTKTASLTQTDFHSKGPTRQFVLRFPPGSSDCTFTYPYSERVDHIKRILLKDFVLIFDNGPANSLPDSVELVSQPSIFKRNAYYPTNEPNQMANSDSVCIPLVDGPFGTPAGNYRFSHSSSRGTTISEVDYGSQRSLPSPITFRLCSSTFVPTVPAVTGPLSIPGGTPIPVAEYSTIILEIETWGHLLEDQRNPLFSLARPYYL